MAWLCQARSQGSWQDPVAGCLVSRARREVQWVPMQLSEAHSSTIIDENAVLLSAFQLDKAGSISPGLLSLIEEASRIHLDEIRALNEEDPDEEI